MDVERQILALDSNNNHNNTNHQNSGNDHEHYNDGDYHEYEEESKNEQNYDEEFSVKFVCKRRVDVAEEGTRKRSREVRRGLLELWQNRA